MRAIEEGKRFSMKRVKRCLKPFISLHSETKTESPCLDINMLVDKRTNLQSTASKLAHYARPPLIAAAQMSKSGAEVMALLIKAKANPEVTDSNGLKAVDFEVPVSAF